MTTMRVGKLGPSTAMIPMASRMNGNASWASASVMIMLSVQPPRKPATRPRVAPTSPPTITAPPAASPRVRRARLGAGSARADARIEEAIEQVDAEVDHDEQHGRDEHGALHDRIVAIVDRLDREPSDAGPGEHGLGDDGAAKQGAELEPGDRDDRHGGVLQGVLGDDHHIR